MIRRARRHGFWPGNTRTQTITVAGANPVTVGTIALIDRQAARGLDGRAGTVIAGERFSESWKSSGLFSYSGLAMLPFMTPSRNRIADPNIALPATSGERVGVAGAGWSVMDSLAAAPPGVR